MATSQRWWRSFPFVLALATLIYIGWSAWFVLKFPYDGIVNFSPSGEITKLDQVWASKYLRLRDVILFIDGVPLDKAYPLYEGKHFGDFVNLIIGRDVKSIPLIIQLVQPPLGVILNDLVPLLVALAFWVIGVGVQSFTPADRTSQIFFLFCQACVLFLTSGLLSSIGPRLTSDVFNFLFWVIGPIMVHFHLHFPENPSLRGQRHLLWTLYTIALVGGLPYLVLGRETIRVSAFASSILLASQLFLAANLLLVVGLLFYAYRREASPGVRGKIRIVVLGGSLVLLPVITLVILPDALGRQPILSYTPAFLFLGLLPLTYAYTIIRHRLITIERHVNRGATYFLVFFVLGAIYIVLNWVLHETLPLNFIQSPLSNTLSNTLLVLGLAIVFPFLSQRIQRLVDKAFYGGWYDYRSAVTQITQGLEQINELPVLAGTIGERLVKTLQLQETSIFLRDLGGDFSVIEAAPAPQPGKPKKQSFSVLPKTSLTYLLEIGMIERASLREALSGIALTPEERQLLESEQVHLWVPVIGHGEVLGLLALGPKLGGDVFSGVDMDILRVVARQMSPLIENIHLVTQLREYAAELEQRVEERTAELHTAKERVEAVLSSVGDGVFVTDLKGEIITVNRAFEEQSGYPSDEVIGQELFNLVSGQENGDKAAEIRKALTSKYSWSGELMARRKEGRQYDAQLTIAPVRNQMGEIMGYVGSQRDITEYKQLERLKDQFILEVSHELRTPVTNMGLFVELLERGKPEKRADYLKILRTETNQLMKMIEDILDLSRLEVGKYKKSAFGKVNLNLLADQVVAAHSPLAREAGLDLTFDPQMDLPLIHGEQNQLSRVIANLLSNAIRYTNAGSVRVSTFLSNGGVCLEVKDTGIGIDLEDYPHLMERFYRGRKVSQSKILGSGLGLSIVKEIVDIHDGRVEWESEEGKGSTFRIWLPS